MTTAAAQGPAHVVDISAGGLAAATAGAGVRLGQAVMLRDDPQAAGLAEAATHGRVLCGPGVDALGAAPGVLREPWAGIDARYVELGGTTVPFGEAAGATLRRAADWIAADRGRPVDRIALVVPTHWGALRRAKAVKVAAAVGLAAQPVRAALPIADALTSSYARWSFVVERAGRGATVSLVERCETRLELRDCRYVLAVDPDDDRPGGGQDERILAALEELRRLHRSTRTGSVEVLVAGDGARRLIELCDRARVLSFPVPATVPAERVAVGFASG